MNRNNTPRHIATEWVDGVERALEFGDSSVLELGAGNAPIESVPALLAMQNARLLQLGNASLHMPAGGLGYAWLAALMQPAMESERPLNTEIVYTGANQIEYATSVSLLRSRLDPVDSSSGSQAVIPASHIYPQTEPGMALTWDSLPFDQIATGPSDAMGASAAGNVADTAVDDGAADWLAWMAVLLALFLIIIAIIL